MTINLHIDRLILSDLPVTGHETGYVQAALQEELMRMLSGAVLGSDPLEQGRTAALGLGRSGAVTNLRGRDITVRPGDGPGELGRRVARSIHHALAGGDALSTRVQRVAQATASSGGEALKGIER